MILGFLTLLIAIAISIVSAYYSILGLVAIFAAAVLPVVVMGAVLELGKLATAVWLHKNWYRAGWTYKSYLIPALLMLMVLTSMGTFGFLSKAHLDQGVPTGNVAAQIELIDTKIATQRGNIEASRKNLSQMDAAVDETLKRSTTEGGAARAAQLRQRQVKDRATVATEIETAQKSIAKLQEERAVIATELRRVEAEVGPIKYVAALIYGDGAGTDLLEKAVRWVIILIVIVFDPLAIVLILAGSKQIEWGRQAWAVRRERKSLAKLLAETPPIPEQLPTSVDAAAMNIVAPEDIPGVTTRAFTDAEIAALNGELTDAIKARDNIYDEWHALNHELAKAYEARDNILKAYEDEEQDNMALHDKIETLEAEIGSLKDAIVTSTNERERVFEESAKLKIGYTDLETKLKTITEERDRLFRAHGIEMQRADELVVQLEELAEVLLEAEKEAEKIDIITEPEIEVPVPDGIDVNNVTKEALIFHPSEGYVTFEGKSISIEALKHSRPDLLLSHNDPVNQILFGAKFPGYARTGDLYIRTDVLPHAVFKFNGNKWVTLNKTLNTTYLQYVPYVQYLIQKIDSGEYDTELLTDYERDEIEEQLKSK